jgi:peptidoglycan/xylan/chitin deacetylase (PgdA/CDA1 family)
MAISAPNAVFYHKNPNNLSEVYKQAKWVGKREYKLGKFGFLIALLRSSLPVSLVIGVFKSLTSANVHFVIFKIVYDFGVFLGILNYLTTGKALPAKPVMITFDDTRLDQFTAALPELNKHGFQAAFFIMTVSLNKPGYMTKEQVKQLSDQGHTIGSHTYDHKNVKTYTPDDWVAQVQKPSQQLQAITGKPVEYFAYPFGLWNKEAISKLKDHDFKAVFQLAADRDENDPLYSIRRIIVTGGSRGTSLQKIMKRSF